MDSIPTSVIKLCPDIFTTLITRLATISFRDGAFPSIYKTASVTPILKNKKLDRDSPANFRPISNLHTISKILERLFLSRVMQHIEDSPNFNPYQSAYRRGYSTETALLRLQCTEWCILHKWQQIQNISRTTRPIRCIWLHWNPNTHTTPSIYLWFRWHSTAVADLVP